MTDDLQPIATDLNLSTDQIEKTVQLLDAGNTIPFITRFRKDETGGLRASQIQSIQFAVNKQRALTERKTFVIKSIDSQGKLDDSLKARIEEAKTSRELEDLYLPYKPKQQSLALTARQQGLEPLANDVFEGDRPDVDLATRATEFVRVDRGLNSVDEVIAGVGHILSERISEKAELRDELRKIIWETGRFVVTTIEPKESEGDKQETKDNSQSKEGEPEAASKEVGAKETADSEPTDASVAVTAATPEAESDDAAAPESSTDDNETVSDSTTHEMPVAETAEVAEPGTESPAAEETATEKPDETQQKSSDPESTHDESGSTDVKEESKPKVEKKKKKSKKKKTVHPFKEYADFDQPIKKIPHYRLLAINRGERAGLLKVKLESDKGKLLDVISRSISDDHPFAEFLKKCSKDALNRLIIPSLEREVRRELAETAEQHAVRVFALNLRNLLLQPPVRNKRILAIDPGYKRGCTLVVLNGLGRMLESERMAVVGNQSKKDDSRKKIADLVERHMVDVIVIGNGTACRQTEEIVSLTLENELAGKGIQYVIVNEAGASCYSTSEIGGQDLPDQTPLVRSAISIGRRLINPLSELVKISPANMGVGLYQHDIKSKHLSESLIEVVRDCVNLVGVDVNTADPHLLSHVAGLNQLTARRIVEYRNENGSFTNREQLRNVSGIGESTFVQAAGFLRVYGGDNPLDETSIHPESYELATNILNKIDATVDQLPKQKPVPVAATLANAPTSEPATETAESTSESDAATAPKSEESEPPVESTNDEASAVVSTNDGEAATTTAGTSAAPSEPAAVESASAKPEKVRDDSSRKWKEAISQLNIDELSKEFSVGKMLMTDVVNALKHPGHDPRQKMDAPIFRSGIIKIDDLKPEMKLTAQVVNVVDFGVFVDIGLGVSCLVHISQLSNRYMKDLHQHYVVCDRLNVWVKEVDKDKRRVQLTAIAPSGSGRGGKRQGSRPPRGKGQGGRGDRSHRGQKGGKNFRKDRRTAKPRKPAKPITEEMLSGDKPMRSFSDLAQFFDKSKGDKK